MLANFLLQICGFETLNRGGWMNINVLVVMLSITAAALIYALSNLLPSGRRESLKGVANYEMIEAFLSLVIVIVLILFSDFACNAGAALVGSQGYTSLFSSVESYLGNLLFVNGLSISTQLFTTSVQFGVVSNIVVGVINRILPAITGVVQQALSGILPSFLYIEIGTAIADLFKEYAALFTEFYAGLLFASFGTLFIPLIVLPLIEAGALTVMAPAAIICRALSFFGPQFRSVSNLFIAMAMGFYFVFPLTLALDSYVASCLNIGLGIPATACSGYTYFGTYLKSSNLCGAYQLPTLSSSIFTSSSALPVNAPLPGFLTGGISGALSIPTTFYGSTLNLNQYLNVMFNAPCLAESYGMTIAAYLFLSIVLLAIDVAITAGFIKGVADGLNAISQVFSSGGFFGD